MGCSSNAFAAPPRKGPKRPAGSSEETDEAPDLLDEEAVDVEGSRPAGKRTSVESVREDEKEGPPLFEE